ncbi:virulence plasmid 28 protein [Pseudomonas sp. COR58]|uniref:Virulence plasmid 28 protein n=1 Tax=Pseudomonas ekonensis TaxID=2842353 RepID=A0ABS6P9U9_9PSED|nr:Tc toxin subunit A [Pseudomonas ekonensis]MBV4456994.1 virulence plasmid 28 protein [Pseudomonas ekonensis]
MSDSSERPALQLLRQVFTEQPPASLETYLEQGGSIFTLVEKGVQGLTRQFALDDEQARLFLRRANSLATYVRRRFIEQRLSGDPQVQGPSSGLLSMVAGPTYERLFATPFDQLCPPNALESCASPVAYLVELLRWIRDRIEPYSVADEKYLLHERRKDLKALSVDFNAVHQAVSSVDVIIAVLEGFINEPEDELTEALIEARYPNGLPYFQHWATCDTVARHYGQSVGEFAHETDMAFPYFLHSAAWNVDGGRAMAHASRLGPYQRELLTEPLVTSAGRDDFYLRNFGADGIEFQNLYQVPFFAQRTKLDAPAIEALLSVREFAPVRSANVTYTTSAPAFPESERHGSVYLNAGTAPAVTVTGSGEGAAFLHRLSLNPLADFVRYDRMNRKIRLDAWLQLPPEQVDALLVAAIRAEVRGGAKAGDWLISDNVVHALGLFQVLREQHGCTAQDFAVFIDEVGIYGRGDSLSQFDQVFNAQGQYRQSLKLDDQPFAVLPGEGDTDLTVNQICSGLAIDPQTYRYLALAIARAQGAGATLKRNATVISAFYRLVKLPRLLGITPAEGVLMLSLLGGERWLEGLAGAPKIHATPTDAPDALNLIHALYSCVDWCHARDLPIAWMIQTVSAPLPVSAAGEPEQQLFGKVRSLLPAALFSHAGLLMAGVPPLPAASWLDLLTALVDPQGLVLPPTVAEAEYPDHARELLDRAVKEGLGDIDDASRAAIVGQMLGVLLQAREAQVSVAKECLAVYAGIEAEQAIRVLAWAGASVYSLLSHVSGRIDQARRQGAGDPDRLLALLADVKRRSAIVAKLGLSAGLLQDYLDYGHKAWLDQDDRLALSLRTFYYLERLARAFELSEQPPQQLLDYLREVNAMPEVSGDAMRLAEQAAAIRLAMFFGWSVQEVLECISRMVPTGAPKLLKSLVQLDLLMRVRMIASRSGMDALTVFLLGKLPEQIDRGAYASAAELALLSLSQTRAPVVPGVEDLKRLVQVTCVPDKYDVIANKPGDKIIFTVTVKNAAGQPLSGVNVHWRARLGSIATRSTFTDGTVKAEFIPGSVMGTDTPMFWLDLLPEEQAPAIEVTHDAQRLTFPASLRSPVPLAPVGAGEEVELYAVLMDRYSNLGKGRLVRWLVEPVGGSDPSGVVIRPQQALTNQDGLTRTFVSCATGGEFIFSVLSESSETQTGFDPITFADPAQPL